MDENSSKPEASEDIPDFDFGDQEPSSQIPTDKLRDFGVVDETDANWRTEFANNTQPSVYLAGKPTPVPKDHPPIPDVGPFQKIGNSFSFTPAGRGVGSLWKGSAVVSPRAIYLISNSTDFASTATAVISGTDADDPRTSPLEELSPVVQTFIDPKGKWRDKSVVVLPKEGVNLVRFVPINNTINVECAGHKFQLMTNLFKGKHKIFMTETGWTINRRVGPIKFDPLSPALKGFERVIMIVLYILLLIALLAYEIGLHLLFHRW